MSKLPKGWAEGTIEDVLGILPSGKQLDQGWSPRCENFPSKSEETWGALKTTAIQDGWFEAEHTKQLPDHLNPKPELEVKSGDVLLTCAGPRIRCGVICRVNEVRRKLFISGKMYRFRPDENIVDPNFLMGLLRSPDQKVAIDQIKTGGSESGLNLTQARFKSLSIKIPPIPEQKRIIRKLDALSARIGNARNHLSGITRLTERYKHGVLGQIFDNIERSTDALGSLTSLITSGSRGWAKYYADEGPLFIRVGDTRRGTPVLDLSDVQHVQPPADGEGKRTKLKTGDLVVSITADLGRVGVVPASVEEAYVNQHIALVRLSDGSSSEFVAWYLISPLGQAQLFQNDRGATKAGIGLDDIRAVQVPRCSPDEQREIVRRIKAAFSKIDRLAAEAEMALKLLERLDQRILAKAFAGELVDQDPTDEPASVLLERIRAERASTSKPKRGRRKKVDATK